MKTKLTVMLTAVALLLPTLAAPLHAQTRTTTPRAAQASAANAAALPPIKFSEFTLPNGLHVILHEDHSTPIVGVNVWYHVGSKNEVPGRTGFAHLFEHMMFQGSRHYDDDYFKPLQEAGGTLNGSTNSDRTNYWEVVPSNFLELALWLESDRMGYLLDAMTEEKLANQRDVVKNEKRQNYDNRPYGLVSAKIAETLYPANHPYHWLTIGSLDDLTAASMDDVKDFFRRFYTPNNASLVIAGDINPAEARRLAEKYFAPIPKGPEVKPVAPAQPRLDKELRVTMDDQVSLPRLYTVWHGVPQFTADDAPLDMLGSVLAGGKGSRLYKSLVYDKQIATDVSAFNGSREIAGTFQIVATAKPGVTTAQLEAAIGEELARIKSEPPTAEEMERAYNARESAFIYSLQTVGGFGGKSDQLNQYAVFRGQPDYFARDLARYRNTTAADVRRVANSFLTDKRLILTVTPRPRGAAAGAARNTGAPVPESPRQAVVSPSQQTAGTPVGAPVSSATTAPAGDKPAGAQAEVKAATQATQPAGAAPPQSATATADRSTAQDTTKLGGLYVQPQPKADPQFKLPTVARRRLTNGLEVLMVRQAELPIVSMNLVLKTGSEADPRDRSGLASLTAAMLDEGTRTRSALEISNDLAAIGARLGTGANFDSSGVSMTTLTKHLDRALGIYADVVTNPAFAADELKLQRDQRLNAILQRRDDANAIAGEVYSRLLYGVNHPYGRTAIGTRTSVEGVTNDEVRRFYETYYRPNNAALIVVGDVQPDRLIPQLERAFANWKAGNVPRIEFTKSPVRETSNIYLVDRPGAAQSVITIGQVGVARSTPDYFPLLVMNTMLGGGFVSRVNLNLREAKGYTYGARTGFDYRREAGPFSASAGVQTAVTKESVQEFLKELRGIRGDIPVTARELENAKQAIIRGFPRSFETPDQIANRLTDVALYGLPDEYFNNYIAQVRRVSMGDVQRVANRYLDPSRFAILVVGDRRQVEPGLRALDAGGSTLIVLDAEGRPVTGATGEGSGGEMRR